MLKQRLLLLLSALMLSPMVLAKPFEYKTCANCGYRNPVHKHNEASYQKAWCKANIKPTKKNESEYTSGTSTLEIPLDYEGQPEAVIIYIRPKDFQEAGIII